MICLFGPSKERTHLARAFTLIEMVISISIISIVMLGMGSALLVAMRALPDEERPAYRVNQASQIANQITAELQEARHINERTSTTVTFTVADRDGDGSPERIRYAWSGTAGDPLTRQYNLGAEVAVLADVNQFDLTYDLKTLTESYPGLPVYGSEILLSSYTAAKELKDYRVTHKDWIGQYFQPSGGSFPEEAISWRVTRVKFEVKEEDSSLFDSYIQLRPPDAQNKPTTTVLEQQIMHEGDLTASYAWQEFSFTGDHGLSPGAGLCLVVQGAGDASAKIRFEDKPDYGATGRLKTGDSGSSWEYKTDKAMRHEIYGQVATPGPDQLARRQHITGVRLTLQAGSDLGTRINTAVTTPNRPELLSAVWELDFDTDPTALNMNGDALNDWNLRQGGSIDPGDLVDGIWYVTGGTGMELDTVPDNSFTELTTVDLRFRSTEQDNGAYFWINADYTGGTFMPVVVTSDYQNQNRHFVIVNVGGTDVISDELANDDFVTFRLLIDPELNTINIRINDLDRGTFAYTPYPPTTDPQRATLYEWGSDAEWDYVRIRVGGHN